MSGEKRRRVSRLRYKKDRVIVITAHRLLCWGLKVSYGIIPNEYDWGEGEFGKPYLKNTEGVYFNISHSERMAMCALHDNEVGADIEKIRPVRDSLAMHIMSDAEKRAYFPGRNEELFFGIWTLKESYLKFKGCGIQGLGGITAYPEENKIISNADGCVFKLIQEIPGFMAAVCSEGNYGFTYDYINMRDLYSI
jgi:4'-phosphopantetheinyl transferase